MKKNGFTLIELLAVIIILGILMIIAIPSVTKYINDSRKETYVDTAKQIIGSARNLVNSGKLDMYDTDVTYYIESSCIKTENSAESPYGKFDKAYVVVTYDGNSYTYYWTSVDETGQGIKNIIRFDNLNADIIESDLDSNDISTLRGIGRRKKTAVISENNNCQKEESNNAMLQVSDETGEELPAILLTIDELKEVMMPHLNSIGNDNYISKGQDVNNYVMFNGELWRVLGIYGNKLKIMRTISIPDPSYKENRHDSNSWTTSYLRSNLNNSYYNSLSREAKNMIEMGVWYIGDSNETSTAVAAYNEAKTATDTAYVGIIATYEFLYSSDGNNCDNVSGDIYHFIECGSEDHSWITIGSSLWTLNARKNTDQDVLYIHSDGYIHSNEYATFSSFPTVYLKSNVVIIGGSGSRTNPYILSF